MLKLGRVTNVKVLFLVLVFVLNLAYSNVFKFSAAILEKGLLTSVNSSSQPRSSSDRFYVDYSRSAVENFQ